MGMKILASSGDLAAVVQEAAPDAEVMTGEPVSCDAALLDIEGDGLRLARQLREQCPNLILVASASAQFSEEAFALHASGYLLRPVTAEKVRRELADLRHPVPQGHRVRVQTFGNFEAYLDGRPLAFKYSKTKELLAYLIDRRGALCTFGEISAILFEGGMGHQNYLKSIRKDLLDTLERAGCSGVAVRQRGRLGVAPEHIDCDYYDWCAGRPALYRGEYMSQYSWSEYTNAMLERTAARK